VRVEELLFLKKKGDSYAPCRISTAAWQWTATGLCRRLCQLRRRGAEVGASNVLPPDKGRRLR